MRSINLVKRYIKVLGVDYTESLLLVIIDVSTRILIGLTLYHEEEGWVAELCDVEAVLIHPDMPLEMSIEFPGGILDIGIITKEFLEEYCILLEK